QAAIHVAQAAYNVEANRAQREAAPETNWAASSTVKAAVGAVWAAQAVSYCCALHGYEPSANVDYYGSREGESAVLEVVKLLGEGPGAVVLGFAAPLRDMFGNPFRPVALDPAWLAWNSGTIPRLAQALSEDRELPSGHLDNHRLAVLADALEDA